jgi:hypothetical protein
MLIETPYKNGDVVSLKLTTGEEIVGKLMDEDSDGLTIKTPLTLVMSPQGVGLQQYMFTTEPDKNYKFHNNSVVIVKKTAKNFADAYQSQTSGLVTAPAGLGDALRTK